MVGPLPLVKLGFLLVKQVMVVVELVVVKVIVMRKEIIFVYPLYSQVSKPFSKAIAARARKSPLFRNYVCIPVAQLYHFYEVSISFQPQNK